MQPTHLVEAKPLGFSAPNAVAQETVERLGRIAEPREVFPQHDHHVWTDPLGLLDQLQFVEPSSPGLIVARDDDLFLLDGEGQGLKGGDLSLYDACVEAVVVLQRRTTTVSSRGPHDRARVKVGGSGQSV